MEILAALGVDSTIAYQFVIFLVTYLFVYNFAFKPYTKALESRLANTEGGQELATRLAEESQKLRAEYETRIRDLNERQKQIFDRARAEAQTQSQQIITEAKGQAARELQEARQTIATQLARAEKDLQGSTPEITSAIMTQILGKEIRL